MNKEALDIEDPTLRLHRSKWSLAFIPPFENMYRQQALWSARGLFRINTVVFIVAAIVAYLFAVMMIPSAMLRLDIAIGSAIVIGLSVLQIAMTFHRDFWRYYDSVITAGTIFQHSLTAWMSYVLNDIWFLSSQSGMLIVVLFNCTMRLRVPALVILQFCTVGVWIYTIFDRGVYVTATGKPFAVIFYFMIVLAISVALGRSMEKLSRREFAIKLALGLERENSEKLLRNVMPDRIANRIKTGEANIADYHGDASVIFTDLSGFTKLASERSPRELVAMLNELYSLFDDSSQLYGLEKLKTIGDSYMAVAGLEDPHGPHAAAAVDCALAMLQDVQTFNSKHSTQLAIRVGINSGPLIAGIIGKRQFSYDIWGDTVNIASRMESHGELNRIQISESTYKHISASHDCEPAGEKSFKGKGMMTTWFVKHRKTSVAG